MRNLLIFPVLALILTSCEAPQQDNSTQEMNRPLSENLKQDGNELSTQVQKDGKVFVDQAKVDTQVVADNTGAKANRMANGVRDGVKRTGQRLRKWWLTPLPDPQPTPVATSYCYHVLQDIVCYRQPMPDWEHRLAGYQGTNAAPPPVAVMQPLPKRNIDSRSEPENRIASAKPVFVNLPPDDKKAENTLEPVAVDPANENLPDPALAPQL